MCPRRYRLEVVTLLWGLGAISSAQEPSFRLSFDAPGRVEGEPGAAVQFQATVKLATLGLSAGEPGAQGWNLSLACDDCAIVGATIVGTAAADSSAGGARVNGFEHTELTSGEGNEGAVSFVILSFTTPTTLDPGGSPHSLLVVTVEGRIPREDLCSLCTLQFVNGRQGVGQPVSNIVTYEVHSLNPSEEDKTVRLCAATCPPGGNAPCGSQLPGDCNQDRQVDISDAVCIFGTLFLGRPQFFPCGDGGGGHRANLALLSANGDRRVDLSDGIYLLTYLFLGGPPHLQGLDCIRIAGCADNAACGN